MQLKSTYITVQCRTCKNTKRLTCKPGMGGVAVPMYCDMGGAPGGDAGDCGPNPFEILPSKSAYVDQQKLKLQVSGVLASPLLQAEHALIRQQQMVPCMPVNSCDFVQSGMLYKPDSKCS